MNTTTVALSPNRFPFLVLLSSLLTGCGGGGQCANESAQELLSVRADVGCPSPRAAERWAPRGSSVVSLIETRVRVPDRTMCWYRLANDTGKSACVEEVADAGRARLSRGYYLAQASQTTPLRDDYQAEAYGRSTGITGCDADGGLYGYLLRGPYGAIQPTQTAGDCPRADQLLELPPDVKPAEFVGSDVYRAIVSCKYDITTIGTCPGFGSPPRPL